MKVLQHQRLKIPFAARQQGFIQGAILFGIALLAAVIGGFALANKTPTTQTTNEQAKINASVFLKQGSDLSEGVARYVFDQGDPTPLTMATTANVGLFDPTKQYAVVQIGPGRAYSGGTAPNLTPAGLVAGSYSLNKNVSITNVGSGSGAWVISTVFADVLTCRRINNMLYGLDITSGAIPTSATAESVWSDGGSVAITLTGANGWTEGCVATSDSSGNRYVYYKVVKQS